MLVVKSHLWYSNKFIIIIIIMIMLSINNYFWSISVADELTDLFVIVECFQWTGSPCCFNMHFLLLQV